MPPESTEPADFEEPIDLSHDDPVTIITKVMKMGGFRLELCRHDTHIHFVTIRIASGERIGNPLFSTTLTDDQAAMTDLCRQMLSRMREVCNIAPPSPSQRLH